MGECVCGSLRIVRMQNQRRGKEKKETERDVVLSCGLAAGYYNAEVIWENETTNNDVDSVGDRDAGEDGQSLSLQWSDTPVIPTLRDQTAPGCSAMQCIWNSCVIM